MKPRRRDRQPAAAASSKAFNPWAPRTAGQAGPASSPAAPPTFDVGVSSVSAPSPSGHTLVSPPLTATLGGRPPVADDARPPGAAPVPPTGWPAPRIPVERTPEPRRRGSALLFFLAFLVGALLVGAAFASYAWGRRDTGPAAAASTTAIGKRATGPLDIQKILDIARPSVVTIQTGGPDSLFGGAGSGVVISPDGLILTNAHVIEGAGGNISVRFSDGTGAEATLVGASTADDIALIQADATGLTPATLGSSDNILVGDPVVAIGNALNLGGDPSVTSGIVSAKDRQISDGALKLDNLIQTDAAINPGNSGGPLVNANGEVVGINTAIIAGAQNIGFSIAIDSVQDLIAELKAGGGDLGTDTAQLGASTLDVSSPDLDQTVKDEFGITAEAGAVVVAVDEQGAASAAGIEAGDVIVQFDGEAVTGSTALTRLVREHEPDELVPVMVERRGERLTFTVTLGS